MRNTLRAVGRWRAAFVAALALAALVVLTSRFVDPVGERYIPFLRPGAADFSYPFNGARALLRSENPYVHDDAELFDPWHRDEAVNGVMTRQFYPPSALLYDVPLALLTGGDRRVASRIWFGVNLAALVGIAALTVLMMRTLSPRTAALDDVTDDVSEPHGFELGLLFLTALAANPGVQLGLERGQSDIQLSLFCWAAIACYSRGKTGGALCLASIATLLKGYSLLLLAGLFVLSMRDPRTRKPAILGVLAPTAVLLLPVISLMPYSQRAIAFRVDMFERNWSNHSFKSIVDVFSPGSADVGRLVLTALGVAITIACALAVDRTRDAAPSEHMLALVVFAVVSLTTLIGASSLSVTYNLIFLLPAVLVLGLSQGLLARLVESVPPSVWGALLVVTVASMWLVKTWSKRFPLDAVGLLGALAVGACFGIATFRQARTGALALVEGGGP